MELPAEVEPALVEFDQTWAEILGSDRCPPVLGLAPLSEPDCEAVSSLVEEASGHFGEPCQIRLLMELLDRFSAIMAVWLARKASEAYDLGTFWENFERSVGIKIPSQERPGLANGFREACSLVMFNYLKPPEPGAFKHVEAFLFQAGLPLCHCDRFAALVRQVERHNGLPDPGSPDAGEEVRDHVLACPAAQSLPMLNRSLRGPAGPLICKAALRVVFEANYQGINPELGGLTTR